MIALRLSALATVVVFFAACDTAETPDDCLARTGCVEDLRSEYDEPAWGPGDVLAVRRVPRNADGSLRLDSAGLYLRRLDGSAEWPLVLDAELGAPAHSPVWSPDGQAVAFEAGYDLYAVDASGGAPRRLTSGARQKVLPAWSPDGRTLAFQVALGWVPDRGVWAVEVDGTGERQLRVPDEAVRCLGCPATEPALLDTYGPGVQWYARSPVWVGGGRLAYVAFKNFETQSRVALYDTASAAVEFALHHPPGIGMIAASPDRTQIAFVGTGRDGEPSRLGVLDLASGRVRWVVDSGTWPSWSPDGTRLVYRLNEYPDIGRSGTRDLWVVDLRTGRRRQVTFATGRYGD